MSDNSSAYCDVVTATGLTQDALSPYHAEQIPYLVHPRSLQLPAGQPRVCQGALLLHRHHLHPVLHDRGRLLVLFLARLQSGWFNILVS